MPSAVSLAAAPDVDPLQTAAIAASMDAALSATGFEVEEANAAALPVGAEPAADLSAFAFATGHTLAAPASGPSDTFAVALNPPVVAGRPVTTPDLGRAADFDPLAPVAFVDPAGFNNVMAPFEALINPLTKPDFIAFIPDPTTDHSWVGNPIPEASMSAAERRCLAEAIYFESRSEPIRGQQAVAQVVINRLINPAYPSTICGVVYQNKNRRNACQFSFACDGIRDVVRDREAWNIAVEIADAVIDGESVYLEEVGAATHYHAVYVHPNWARTMEKKAQIGLHIFYRTYGGGWI